MKLRELLERFRLRAAHVGKGERSIDDVDAAAGDAAASWDAVGPDSDRRPANWLPSQQDERPRY